MYVWVLVINLCGVSVMDLCGVVSHRFMWGCQSYFYVGVSVINLHLDSLVVLNSEQV